MQCIPNAFLCVHRHGCNANDSCSKIVAHDEAHDEQSHDKEGKSVTFIASIRKTFERPSSQQQDHDDGEQGGKIEDAIEG